MTDIALESNNFNVISKYIVVHNCIFPFISIISQLSSANYLGSSFVRGKSFVRLNLSLVSQGLIHKKMFKEFQKVERIIVSDKASILSNKSIHINNIHLRSQILQILFCPGHLFSFLLYLSPGVRFDCGSFYAVLVIFYHGLKVIGT